MISNAYDLVIKSRLNFDLLNLLNKLLSKCFKIITGKQTILVQVSKILGLK